MDKKKTVTGQTDKRDSKGRFIKGTKPKNGFDKNPQNIAPGGYWRYKENGKSAIIDIFKMSIDDFNSIEKMDNKNKTVLDVALFVKFKSALEGNSRDMNYLFDQAFGQAPRYLEAREMHVQAFKDAKSDCFRCLTKEEVERLLESQSDI